MADSFIKHPIGFSEVKVIWSQDLTYIEKCVNGSYYLPLSEVKINNINILCEDLFVYIVVLRAKIISKHCQ